MNKSTVIWSCPLCGHGTWGRLHEAPDFCAGCGEGMSAALPNRQAAVETYFCDRYHRKHEDPAWFSRFKARFL
ncbi:MAG: hypothetical protein AB1473_19135 [Thermodesulfobacteriota bacterium]